MSIVPFIKVSNLLQTTKCDDIINALETHLSLVGEEHSKATVIQSNKSELQKEIRSTEICFLPTDSSLSSTFFHIVKEVNKTCKWNFDINNVESIQVLKYNVGDFYMPHMDVLAPSKTNTQRKLTAMVWLTEPEDYEGGEFIIYPLDTDPVSLKLRKGDAVILPSFMTHQASEVTDGKRYSTTAWIEGPNWR